MPLLACFAADVDLDQDGEGLAESSAPRRSAVAPAWPSRGIDRVKDLRCLGGFVRLQVSDHVELGIAQFGSARTLSANSCTRFSPKRRCPAW